MLTSAGERKSKSTGLAELMDIASKFVAVSAGVGLTSFSLGYMEYQEYFHDIGAPWAIGLATTSQIAESGGPIFLLSMLFVPAIFLMEGLVKKGIVFAISILSSCAFAVLQWKFFGSGRLEDILLISLLIWGVAVASVVRLIILDVRDGERKFILFGSVALVSLTFYLPVSMGKAKAAHELGEKFARMPSIHMDGGHVSKWKLFTALGDKVLIGEISDDGAVKSFMVVELDKVKIDPESSL